MEEPLFAELEEKPTVVKLEEPSDYEEKPIVDTEDFINSREIPTNDMSGVTVSPATRLPLHKNQEISFLPRSEWPKCPCGIGFRSSVDFSNHEAAFKGQPHVFCKPCERVYFTEDFDSHVWEYHTTDNKKAKSSVYEKPEEKPHFGMQPWERAAGARRAEDIMLGIDPGCSDQKEEEPCQPKRGGIKRKYSILRTRIHGVPKPEDYVCQDCRGHFAKDTYYSHRMKWLGRPHSYCCGQEVAAELLEKHKNSKKHQQMKEPDPCAECGMEFSYWSLCRSHALTFGGKPHRFCRPCNTPIHEVHKENHERSVRHRIHLTEEKPRKCDDCGLRFLTASGYGRHFDQFNGLPHFYCGTCKTMTFGTGERHLLSNAHRVNVAKQNPLMPWKCHVTGCGAAFRSGTMLKDHLSSLHHLLMPEVSRRFDS